MFQSDRPSPPAIARTNEPTLSEIVRFVDQLVDDDTGNLLLRLAGCPAKLGMLPLGGGHPLDSLLGFTAPGAWHALGVRCPARAYRFDADDAHDAVTNGVDRQATGATAQHEGMFVMALDRSGRGVGRLREGDAVTLIDEAPQGMVADACRRALGLPTAAAPASTVELWVRLWLDRVIDAAAHDDTQQLDSWRDVARLHPAAPMGPLPARLDGGSPIDPCPTADPCALAEATQTLATALPWSHLRRDPEVLDTGRPPVTSDLASWMDDGLFARSVLATLTDLPYAAQALDALLPAEVVARVAETVGAVGSSWPASS